MSTSPHPTTTRALRTIPVAVAGPDPRATAITNADWLLKELTSSRRFSTLARLPTKDEILGAIETIADWKRGRGDDAERSANVLRALCENWTPVIDIPPAISDAARALMKALGALEPPCGWDNDTGYPDVWRDVAEIQGTSAIMKSAAGETLIAEATPAWQDRGEEASKRAAALAQAMCQALNLAGLFASPRILSRITEFPSREHVIEHIDAFAVTLTDSSAGNTDARSATARLRAACASWSPGPEAPVEVQAAARAFLSSFGCPEPPGGWDAFEGVLSEPEAEDPDPRPPPTQEEEAGRPDVFRVAAAIEWCRYVGSPKMLAKLAPAVWARRAVEHVDTLLAAFRPVRSNRTAVRAKLVSVLHDLERIRAGCEARSADTAPPLEIQERARAVLVFLNVASTVEACETFEEEPSPAYQ